MGFLVGYFLPFFESDLMQLVQALTRLPL